jgi:hypothetical protein
MTGVFDALPAEARNPALHPFGEFRQEDGIPVRHDLEAGALDNPISEVLGGLPVAIDVAVVVQGTAQAALAEGLQIDLELLRRQKGRISGDAVAEAAEGGLPGAIAGGAAAGGLRSVHAAVGLADELASVIGVFGEGRKAEGDSDAKLATLPRHRDLVLNGAL